MKIALYVLSSFFIVKSAFAFPFNCPDDENRNNQDWTFIDCVHDPIDCELLAWRCEYDEYKYKYRGYPCSNRVYMRFACYGRERLNSPGNAN